MTNPLFAGHTPDRRVRVPRPLTILAELWRVRSPHSGIEVKAIVVEQPHGLELRVERAGELHLSESLAM